MFDVRAAIVAAVATAAVGGALAIGSYGAPPVHTVDNDGFDPSRLEITSIYDAHGHKCDVAYEYVERHSNTMFATGGVVAVNLGCY